MSRTTTQGTTQGALDVVLKDALDNFRGAWRFRWLALGVAWLVAIALWSVIFAIPKSYEAQARVYVDTRTTLSEVTKGISVETNVDGQLLRVRQALLGAPELTKVARQTDLLLEAKTPREEQELIGKLRKKIQITASVGGGSGVYTIAYENRSRDVALKVVDRLLNTFVEGTLGGKREGAETATRFLREQIADYEKRLHESEERLAEFKKKNVGLMPGSEGDYFQRLQAEEQNYRKVTALLGIALRKRDELGRQLRGESPLLTAGDSPTSTPGAPMAASNDTASRIRDAETRLDELLLRYTDSHPSVIALRNTVKELKDRQAAEIAAVKRGDPGAAARTGLSANPVYQQLQMAYNQANVEVASTQFEAGQAQRRIAELRSRLDVAPGVEADFAQLNRDYDVTKAQYQQLLTRLEQTKVSDGAEQTGIVRFEIIDPPIAAYTPVAPNRPLLISVALVAALAAGVGVAVLLQMLKPVITSARGLSSLTGLPVLGEVSLTQLDAWRGSQRRSVLTVVGGAVALIVVGVAIVLSQTRVEDLLKGFGA